MSAGSAPATRARRTTTCCCASWSGRRSIHHIPRVLYHWRKHPQSTASVAHAKPWALDAGRAALEDYVRRNSVECRRAGRRGARPVPRPAPHPRSSRSCRSSFRPPAGCGRWAASAVDLLAQAIASVDRADRLQALRVRRRRRRRRGAADDRARARRAPATSVLRFERPGPFNFSAKINAGAAAARRRAPRAVQRRPRSDDARMADGDAGVLTGAGDRRGRRKAALSRTAGCSTSAWRSASPASPPTHSISIPGRLPATPAAPSSPATIRPSPAPA